MTIKDKMADTTQEQLPVEQELFDRAIKIKLERGQNYGNGDKQAYDIALDMFPGKEETYVAIWPVAQKLGRLMTLAKEKETLDMSNEKAVIEWARHWDDTSIDLVNYAAMQWVRVCRPLLLNAPFKVMDNGGAAAVVKPGVETDTRD